MDDISPPKGRKRGRPNAVDATGTSSRLRMILVAERLFSDRSIEGVPIREIVHEAGQANSNAVHYHFGSKQGLVFEIFAHRVAEMELCRKRMLETGAREGLLSDVRYLLEIWMLPYLDLVDENGCHSYASFMAQYLVRYRPAGIKHAGDTPDIFSPSLRELRRLTGIALSHLPPELFQYRLEFAHLTFFNMIIRWDNTPPEIERMSLDILVQDALNVATVAFSLPAPAGAM